VAPTVDRILAGRQALAARPRRAGVLYSLLLHGGLVAAVLVTPLLTATDRKPPRFVRVALVSAQALGVQDPEPAPAPARPPAPAPARPAPPRPEPAPAVKPTPRSPQDSAPPRAAAPDTLQRRQGSPTGSSTGTAALGARVGFDNPSFRHSYFVDRLTAMLAAQWRRPALGGELVALVHFTIHRDGSMSDARVVQSSGYSSYDLAALRAVQQAAPFPPLPQSFEGASLGVTVEFI